MILWGVQNLRQLFLLYTNITPIQNYNMHAASSFTFRPVQLYSTCNRRSDKNKQLTIIKPTQTGTNFLLSKIIGAPKKFKTQARPLVRPSSVNFCQYF
jgi:hypothetical protein